MARLAIVFSLLIFASAALSPAQDAYAPLALYNGGWTVHKAGAAADHLVNHCARTGFYYVCEQVVNGKTAALIIFVPADSPGAYHTQAVLPSGQALGRDDLTIHGDQWVYLGKAVDGSKTTWFRTTNVFTGKDHIHFQQAQSSDGTHWTDGPSGDEDRVTASATR